MRETRLEPKLRAAQKEVSAARQSGDQSRLVDSLIALLEITPEDQATRDRLASAAQRDHQEQRVLDHLARHDQADLSAPKIEGLHRRVYLACIDAIKTGDLDLARSGCETLALVDKSHPRVAALRESLAEIAASGG